MKAENYMENPVSWMNDPYMVLNDSVLIPEESGDIDFEFEFGRGMDSFGRRIYKVSIEDL